MFIHILRDRGWVTTPPWATHERLTGCAPDQIVYPDCCCCKMRADETVVRIRHQPDCPDHGARHPHVKFLKGHPAWDRDREDRLWWASYYEADQIITCGPGLGCNAAPRRRWGTEGRRNFVFGGW